MTNGIKLAVAAIFLTGLVHTASAETATPIDTRNSHSGSQFVWVTAITGHNESGEKKILFSDWQGALLPVAQLAQAGRLIKSQGSVPRGTFQGLRLQLADKILTVNASGMQQQSLPQNLSTEIVLRGQIEIDRNKVVSNTKILPHAHSQQVALLQK